MISHGVVSPEYTCVGGVRVQGVGVRGQGLGDVFGSRVQGLGYGVRG